MILGRSRKKIDGSTANSGLETTSGSSTESDSDVLLDGEEPELLGSGFGSEDDSIAVEISTLESRDLAKRAPTAGRRTVQQRRDDSDDDF